MIDVILLTGPRDPPVSRHPEGTRARVLLTSVFGLFVRDDEYGSRRENPMELYHNQVTRAQGPFSLRMFHRSWGIMLIQHNISAPCTVLDYPTRSRFIRELESGGYDIVGISGIIVKLGKVREIERELGGAARWIDGLVGPLLLWSAKREVRRHPAGRALEPRTFVERRNWPIPDPS